MSRTISGTVKETGAVRGDVLLGVDKNANPGLILEALGPVSKAHGGGGLPGPFRVIAAGTGKYAAGIEGLLHQQTVFNNGPSFIDKLKRQPGCEKATNVVNANTLRRADPTEAAVLRDVDRREAGEVASQALNRHVVGPREEP
jgi:hypothetical protein